MLCLWQARQELGAVGPVLLKPETCRRGRQGAKADVQAGGGYAREPGLPGAA